MKGFSTKGDKQFVVIGLGILGAAVTENLFNLGKDVMAIDKDGELVQDMSDKATHAVQLDATDENALKKIGIKNFDVAIVCIGSDIQESIMVALLLKELGIKYIICKANNELHAKVLKKIGVDKIIIPERETGKRIAHNIISNSVLDFIELSEEYSIAEIKVPPMLLNKTLKELDIRAKYGLNVIAIKGHGCTNINVSPTAADVLQDGDILITLGTNDDLARIEKMIE